MLFQRPNAALECVCARAACCAQEYRVKVECFASAAAIKPLFTMGRAELDMAQYFYAGAGQAAGLTATISVPCTKFHTTCCMRFRTTCRAFQV